MSPEPFAVDDGEKERFVLLAIVKYINEGAAGAKGHAATVDEIRSMYVVAFGGASVIPDSSKLAQLLEDLCSRGYIIKSQSTLLRDAPLLTPPAYSVADGAASLPSSGLAIVGKTIQMLRYISASRRT
ncbi:MAG: hypothetical protein ACP5T3_00535 [Candidatus Micrarchaeia archaeon]